MAAAVATGRRVASRTALDHSAAPLRPPTARLVRPGMPAEHTPKNRHAARPPDVTLQPDGGLGLPGRFRYGGPALVVPLTPPGPLGAARARGDRAVAAHPRCRLWHGTQSRRIWAPRPRRRGRHLAAGGRVLPSARLAGCARSSDRGSALRGRQVRPDPRHRRDRAPARGRPRSRRAQARGRSRGPPGGDRAGLQLALERARPLISPLSPLHPPGAPRADARRRLGAGDRYLLLQQPAGPGRGRSAAPAFAHERERKTRPEEVAGRARPLARAP